MAENSKIEWCDHTFNPWRGCTKVSPGCANCYAETLSHRNPAVLGEWGPGRPRVRAAIAQWLLPLKWDRQAGDYRNMTGYRPRVFCASLADWLDDEVPVAWLADLLALILRTPNLDWLLLTKRPQLWRRRINAAMVELDERGENIDSCALTEWIAGMPPANVWIGTSVEDQTRADERIPHLLRIPAKVRFLSCEPLLGPVDLTAVRWDAGLGYFGDCMGPDHIPHGRPDDAPRIHWVIAGGESGPDARPMHPDWVRSLRDQCAEAGVSFFMKQMGGVRKPFPAIPEDLNIKQWPA